MPCVGCDSLKGLNQLCTAEPSSKCKQGLSYDRVRELQALYRCICYKKGYKVVDCRDCLQQEDCIVENGVSQDRLTLIEHLGLKESWKGNAYIEATRMKGSDKECSIRLLVKLPDVEFVFDDVKCRLRRL